jgi:hypothetical protein
VCQRFWKFWTGHGGTCSIRIREGFVPREVEHRDAEVTHLSGVLEPIVDSLWVTPAPDVADADRTDASLSASGE